VKIVSTFVGSFFPRSGRRVPTPRAGIMEYWNNGKDKKPEDRRQNETRKKSKVKSLVSRPLPTVDRVTEKEEKARNGILLVFQSVGRLCD
jgi:hypothetical protein